MAVITNIKKGSKEDVLEVKISKEELSRIGVSRHVLIIPISLNFFKKKLTAGRLGTSFRIMLPKKTLEKEGITSLPPKLPAQFFDFDHQNFLIVKLKKEVGVPVFEE